MSRVGDEEGRVEVVHPVWCLSLDRGGQGTSGAGVPLLPLRTCFPWTLGRVGVPVCAGVGGGARLA